MDAPKLYYGYASYLGFTDGHPSKCQDLYPKCPFTSEKMLHIYASDKSNHDNANQLRRELRKDDDEYQGFKGRFLDTDDKSIDKHLRYHESLTSYERKRRQARKQRVEYLQKRRQNIIDKRKNKEMGKEVSNIEQISNQKQEYNINGTLINSGNIVTSVNGNKTEDAKIK